MSACNYPETARRRRLIIATLAAARARGEKISRCKMVEGSGMSCVASLRSRCYADILAAWEDPDLPLPDPQTIPGVSNPLDVAKGVKMWLQNQPSGQHISLADVGIHMVQLGAFKQCSKWWKYPRWAPVHKVYLEHIATIRTAAVDGLTTNGIRYRIVPCEESIQRSYRTQGLEMCCDRLERWADGQWVQWGFLAKGDREYYLGKYNK